MSSWFTEKLGTLVKEATGASASPGLSGASGQHLGSSGGAGGGGGPSSPSGGSSRENAEEIAATLESRARALTSPQSAAWLLGRWSEQCSEQEAAYVLRLGAEQGSAAGGDVWHLTFRQVLLRSQAFEAALETCGRVPALRAALRLESEEGVALRKALSSTAERMLLPGALQLWPALLRAILDGEDGGDPLPWSSWARRLLGALKRPWRDEALPKALRRLDGQVVDLVMRARRRAGEMQDASSQLRGGEAAQPQQLSKQGIRAALLHGRKQQSAAEAATLREKVVLLCDACEKLLAARGGAEASVREVEQLVADAAAASTSLDAGLADLGAENEVLGKAFSEVGTGLHDQITGMMLTQEQFAKRRKALSVERESLAKRLMLLDSEVAMIDKEVASCAAQIEQLRARFSNNSEKYDGTVGGGLSAQKRLEARKRRAASLQECAEAAVGFAREDADRRLADWEVQLRRRRAELAKACAGYLRQERAVLALAVDGLDAAGSRQVRSGGTGGGGYGAGGDATGAAASGEIGEEVATAVAATQDAWRRAQAALLRAEPLLAAPGDAAETRPSVPTSAPAAAGSEARLSEDGGGAAPDQEEFFASEVARGRCVCADCESAGADWATVTYGAYLCMDCAGRHRGLGVHLSFVRSVTMDRWSVLQLRHMRLGGSDRFREFMDGFPDIRRLGVSSFAGPEALRRRYASRAAGFYRRRLAAEAEGRSYSAPAVAPEEGLLEDDTASGGAGASAGGALAGDLGDNSDGEGEEDGAGPSLEEERKLLEEAYLQQQVRLQNSLLPSAI
eukprot:TRINITY_DN15568_c0_g1_i1.p1 TRINITY_DN15568_c0_g1~~TRINITY_DN15568_c0_g1_i1.p1  ORF type:complete len:795 (-),score=218.99 TRINITY_DN15568_c0_g1_i1:76-2460(-)